MITLGVKDLERAIEFYHKGLGLPKIESPPTVAFFDLHGSWLGLYPWDALAEDAQVSGDGSGFRGVTISYNTSSEQEVNDVIELALGAGATLIKKPQKVFWGGFSGYFADLDGHLWEVAHNPFMWIGPEKISK